MGTKTNSRGFTIVEVVIIIVILAIIGLVGWLVWNKNENTQKKQTTQQNTDKADSETIQPETDETATWTLATTQAKGFSMRIPDGWEAMIDLSKRLYR